MDLAPRPVMNTLVETQTTKNHQLAKAQQERRADQADKYIQRVVNLQKRYQEQCRHYQPKVEHHLNERAPVEIVAQYFYHSLSSIVLARCGAIC